MAKGSAAIGRCPVFPALLEDAPVACQMLDSDGRLLMVNQAWLELLGHRSREEILGRRFADLLAGEGGDQFERGFSRLLERGDSPHQELLLAGEGRQPTVELIWKRFVDTETAAKLVFCLLIDVSEQANLRRQLVQARKMEAIGQLAGGIAHDFNNILSVIIGYADILRAKMPAGDPMHLDLDQIQQAAQRAAQLTSSLLSFSRRQLLNLARIDMDRHLAATQKLLRRLIGEDIEFSVDLACGRHLLADAHQLDQMLINLVVNARDAMPTGGTLRIATKSVGVDADAMAAAGRFPDCEYAVLEVSDTGTGMDEATLSQIFEPFFTTKEEGRGTGLGLATVYGIVKQHNGWIEVDSKPGRGSSFKIFLPATAEAPPEEEAKAGPEERTGGRETILLVEDEEHLRNVTGEVLRRFGYTVLTAADGEEATRVFNEHQREIDLLVLDRVLPKKYGYEVWREASRLRPDIGVLFISGYPDSISLGETVPPGSGDFLQKPFSPPDLLAKIRRLLDGN